MTHRCSHCYTYGHNTRTCPELIDGRMAAMSKTRRYHIRQNEAGLCRMCTKPLSPRSKVFCTEHLEITNKQKAAQRKRRRRHERS